MVKLTRQERENKLDPVIRDLLMKTCPKCDSTFINFLIKERMWKCNSCGHEWGDLVYG